MSTETNKNRSAYKPESTEPICSFCNWTNTGCLNIAEPMAVPRWICHGCVKRYVEVVDEQPPPERPKPQIVNGRARRCQVDLYTNAEVSIARAMAAVEEMPAHPWLTEAVTLLGEAKDRVADFVEIPEKSAAQKAYEAYCGHAKWKSLATGADLPQWAEVKPEIKEGWKAVATAMANASAESRTKEAYEVLAKTKPSVQTVGWT